MSLLVSVEMMKQEVFSISLLVTSTSVHTSALAFAGNSFRMRLPSWTDRYLFFDLASLIWISLPLPVSYTDQNWSFLPVPRFSDSFSPSSVRQ